MHNSCALGVNPTMFNDVRKRDQKLGPIDHEIKVIVVIHSRLILSKTVSIHTSPKKLNAGVVAKYVVSPAAPLAFIPGASTKIEVKEIFSK